MASLIDSLINIMNDENRQYTELLDLSNNKTTAIVKGDVGQLQEIFGKEQKLIDILNRLEMERPQTANYGKGAYEETGGMGSTSFDARQ